MTKILLDLKDPIAYRLKISEELSKECSSLLSQVPLTTVGYIKLYETGDMLHLSTNKEWLKECWTNHVFNCPTYFDDMINNLVPNKFYFFVKTGSPADPVSTCQYQFGFWNSLILARKRENYIELFAFHSSANNTPFNIYQNQPHIFKKFALYFNYKFHDTLSNIPQKALQHWDDLANPYNQSANVPIKHQVVIPPIKRFYINEHEYVTARQAQYIGMMLQGKSAKEIAQTLGISFKTVESSLDSARVLLHITNKSELLSLIVANDLQDVLINETEPLLSSCHKGRKIR